MVPIFAFVRESAAGKELRYSDDQSKFPDGFRSPRVGFYGPDPDDPDAIPVYEFEGGQGGLVYATEMGGPPGWIRGEEMFRAYRSASPGRTAIIPGFIRTEKGSHFVTAPPSILDKIPGAEQLTTEPFYVVASDPSRWMEQNTAIHTKKLRHICLPCAHDAGTATLQDIKTDDNGEDIAGFMNTLKEIGDAIAKTGIGIIIDIPLWLSNNLFSTLKGLGRAQSQSIKEQLEGGIRGLDLRVYYYSETNEFYTYHGALGEKIPTILSEISSFLSSHPGEILYVTFTHSRHLDTQALKDRLTDMIRSELGPYAYVQTDNNKDTLFEQTYDDIINQGSPGSKVVIVYSEATGPEFWPSKYTGQGSSSVLDGFYSNKSDIDGMIQGQIDQYQKAVKDNLPFSLFMTLTPQEKDVYERVAVAVSGPLAVAALPVALIPFYGWGVLAAVEALCASLAIYGATLKWKTLEELTALLSPTLVQKVEDNFVPATGPNLISLLWLDFYEKSGVIDLAIRLSNKS